MLTWWNHDPEEEVNVGWNQQNVPMNQYYSKHLFWGETPRPHKPPQTAIFFHVVNKLNDITGDKGGGQISSELCVYFLNKNTDTSFGWQQSRRPTKTAIFTSSTEGEGGYVFPPFCLFVSCKIEAFSSVLVRQVCYVCLSVCLSVHLSTTGHNLKPIFRKLHQMVEFDVSRKPVVFEIKRTKSQHQPKVNNFGEISKILNFHLTDLKF